MSPQVLGRRRPVESAAPVLPPLADWTALGITGPHLDQGWLGVDGALGDHRVSTDSLNSKVAHGSGQGPDRDQIAPNHAVAVAVAARESLDLVAETPHEALEVLDRHETGVVPT